MNSSKPKNGDRLHRPKPFLKIAPGGPIQSLINRARRGLAPPSLIEPPTNHQLARRGRWCLSPPVRARAVIFILAGVAPFATWRSTVPVFLPFC